MEKKSLKGKAALGAGPSITTLSLKGMMVMQSTADSMLAASNTPR